MASPMAVPMALDHLGQEGWSLLSLCNPDTEASMNKGIGLIQMWVYIVHIVHCTVCMIHSVLVSSCIRAHQITVYIFHHLSSQRRMPDRLGQWQNAS